MRRSTLFFMFITVKLMVAMQLPVSATSEVPDSGDNHIIDALVIPTSSLEVSAIVCNFEGVAKKIYLPQLMKN